MENKILVQNIMTKKVISVHPETLFLEAVAIIFKYDFDGVPVVDKDNKLVGILTEYDFVVKGSMVHLPTLIKLFKKIPFHKKDKEFLDENLKEIFSLRVKDVMNNDPLIVYADTDVQEAAKLFAEHHRVNPIPVVDRTNTLLGILSRYDIIKMYAHSLGVKDGAMLKNKPYVERKINETLARLKGEFVLVTKFRTHFWLVISLAFVLIGFLIAMFLIMRIRIYH